MISIGCQISEILIQAYIFDINLVNFLALKLTATCDSYWLSDIRNLNTGLYFCHKFGEFSSIKVDCNATCNSYWVSETLIQAHIFAINLENFLALKLTATCDRS